jgi:uncharacterized membrane protein YqjE
MWKTALKLVAQLLIAKFLRNHMQDAENNMTNNAQHHFSAVKQSVAALVESHAALFKAQFHSDMQRVAKSLLGLTFIFFAMLCSGLTALMWLFATAWNSPHRDAILGVTMILPIIIAIGIYLAIRYTWKKQPLFEKSMVQIESDWQVFRQGLDGTADTSDEATR